MIGAGEGQAVRAMAVSVFCTTSSVKVVTSFDCGGASSHPPKTTRESNKAIVQQQSHRARDLGPDIFRFVSNRLASLYQVDLPDFCPEFTGIIARVGSFAKFTRLGSADMLLPVALCLLAA
jgi:hypothetical protein